MSDRNIVALLVACAAATAWRLTARQTPSEKELQRRSEMSGKALMREEYAKWKRNPS